MEHAKLNSRLQRSILFIARQLSRQDSLLRAPCKAISDTDHVATVCLGILCI